MKNLLFLLYLFFVTFWNAQKYRIELPQPPSNSSVNKKAGAFIDVNTCNYPESNYSVEDLVKKVLIKGQSSCAGSVFNVKVSPNDSLTDPKRSYGYFNKGTINFPFDEGIMLMTGFARNAGNSPVGNLNGVLSTNKEFSALIFDRYGKEVFRSSSANYIWKGDYNGSVNPTGSYWYQVFWIDGVSGKVIQKTGWIVVKNRN